MSKNLNNRQDLLQFKYSIGQKIKMFRKESQDKLAEKAQLSHDTISEIECGNVVMGVDSLIKICNALNITPNDIFEEFIENKIGTLNNTIIREISNIDLSLDEEKLILDFLQYVKKNKENK